MYVFFQREILLQDCEKINFDSNMIKFVCNFKLLPVN